jgi:hypothetical protein
MKLPKSLKRPVVVILLVAVIGIIVFSVVRYLMGGKEQFVEGAAVVNASGCNAQSQYFNNGDCISNVATMNKMSEKNIDTTSGTSPFSGTASCGIDSNSISDVKNIKVGCKTGSGNSVKIVSNFDLTKCQKNGDGKYIVSNKAGTFTCPTVGPTTRPTTAPAAKK